MKSHMKYKTSEYRAWAGMIQRCRNPNKHCYKNYGGRGIQICDRWLKFENFYSDMGTKPSSQHSLDRIDVDGNYEPKNCRWATYLEQCSNMRKNKYLEFGGERLTLTEWAKRLDLDIKTICYRIKTGRPLEQILTSKKYAKRA